MILAYCTNKIYISFRRGKLQFSSRIKERIVLELEFASEIVCWAVETISEDSIKFICSVDLMFVVCLTTTSTNVSISPFSETSHDLFHSFTWIFPIVSFIIKEIEIIVIVRSSSSIWSWIIDFQFFWDNISISITIIQKCLFI